MEAAPRLPMISFELKTSPEPVSFAAKLKQYIASFYHEDPESYNGEVQQLDQLRGAAVRPPCDVTGVQTLKRYYCQLRFLKSRFPMEKGGACAPTVMWRDAYAGTACSAQDIDLELMSVLYNVGALHSQLGAADARHSAEGMKMACTHFQCGAWALQSARELYPQHAALSLAPELLRFMELVCLAQAQECILEKSMSDSRKCSIIAKVAAQAAEYYVQACTALTSSGGGGGGHAEDSQAAELVGGRAVKDWCRYLRFKAAYHGCVSLLYQGQQSEEQQKMGERCALYQAAAERLEEARRLASSPRLAAVARASAPDIEEALAFTQDVVEGKRKAARNENEFIYHETVPERDALPPLQGASLVRPVPFGLADPDVSGPDIFGRLVPMEAHEASSVYSERKAELLRQTGAAVEQRDQELDDFMASLHHVDSLVERLARPQTVPQEVVDRAAALSARPQAAQALVEAMGKLSAVHHDVDSLLNEAQTLIETEREAAAAANSDGRVPTVCMPLNDLSREAAKYREALSKANESNEALHRAMTAHVANLRVLGQPLAAVDRHIPRVALPDAAADGAALAELRRLLAKVDEMRTQRSQLLAALREAAQQDDITGRLVIAGRDRPHHELDRLFDTELAKHRPQAALIEQNLAAQQNILVALTDTYARLSNARKHVNEAFRRRDQTVAALVASYDAYEDLLAKANKGIDFYQKLETNVTKLLQRLRSTCRVQEEEREQKSSSGGQQPPPPAAVSASGPKLRDYLQQPRPAPLGSEHSDTLAKPTDYNHRRAAQGTVAYQPPPPYQPPASAASPRQPQQQHPAYGHPQGAPGSTVPSTTYSPQQYSAPAANLGYMQRPQYQVPPSTASTGSYSVTTPSLSAAYSAPAVAPSIYQQPPPATQHLAYQQPYGVPQQPKQYQYTPPPVDHLHSPKQYQYAPGQAKQYAYMQPEQAQVGRQYAYTPPSNVAYLPATGSNVSNVTPASNSMYAPPPAFSAPYVPPPSSNTTYISPASSNTTYIPAPSPNTTYAASPSPNAIYAASPAPNVTYVPSSNTTYAPPSNIAYVPPSNTTYVPPPATNTPYVPQTSVYASYGNAYPAYSQDYNPYQSGAQMTGKYQQPQTIPTPYVPAVAPVVAPRTTVAPVTTPMTTATSNVDLLAGLDFNVSQVPLDPVKAEPNNVKSSQPETEPVVVNADPQEPLQHQQSKVDLEREKLHVEVDMERARVEFLRAVEQLEHWLGTGSDQEVEARWRELQQRQEKECATLSISVARCYPSRNRCPDSLPYDRNRFELPCPPAVDDYINASHVPKKVVLTQAPLPPVTAFWGMVQHATSDTVVCLMTDSELVEAGLSGGYWGREHGVMQGSAMPKVSPYWTERELVVANGSVPPVTHQVTHIQLTVPWPGAGLDDASLCEALASLALELARRVVDGRSHGPLIVHCLTGVGRSGVLCLLLWAAADMLCSGGPRLLDVQQAAANLAQYRRNPLRDRMHLAVAYRALQRMARFVLPAPPHAIPVRTTPEPQPQEMEPVSVHDPLSDLDPLWKLKVS